MTILSIETKIKLHENAIELLKMMKEKMEEESDVNPGNTHLSLLSDMLPEDALYEAISKNFFNKNGEIYPMFEDITEHAIGELVVDIHDSVIELNKNIERSTNHEL